MNRRLLALRLVGLGWYVATCVVVGTVGGLVLDKYTGTTPIFTLLGVLFGTFLAFYGLYKMVSPLFSSGSGPRNPRSNGENS